MKEILFSLNIVLPMAILLGMGYLFRKSGLFSPEFIQSGSKLCFYVLLSCSLFKNLYDSVLSSLPVRMILFTVISILCLFLFGILFAKAISSQRNQIGVLIQGVTRSNFAYIGIPLSTMMFTESALVSATSQEISILSIFVIPLFNILAVSALTYYGESKEEGSLLARTLRNLLRNPCILSIIAGLSVLLFRMLVPQSAFLLRDHLPFLYKVIGYLASMSTPLALMIVGAGLNFSHSAHNSSKLYATVFVKNLLFPGLVMLTAYLLKGFTPVDYAVMVSVFASPTAVASAVMAGEMGGDRDLANEIVVYTTIFSIISLLLIIYVLKTARCL